MAKKAAPVKKIASTSKKAPAKKAEPVKKSAPAKKQVAAPKKAVTVKKAATAAKKSAAVPVKKPLVSAVKKDTPELKKASAPKKEVAKQVEIPVKKEPVAVAKPLAPEGKIKTILVSQPKPETDKNPYLDLAKRLNLKIDFRPFIHIEGVNAGDFRKERVNIQDHTAVILTSRNAVDHFFRMCTELRITVPETLKYFCISESTAFYLQKYVVYRKRKIFHGKQTFADLIDLLKKNKTEKFLVPCSDIHKQEIPETLEEQGVHFTKAIMYKTVCSDLSDLANVNYDVLVFFSPSGVKSLLQNFPDFKQNNTKIAAFGPTTHLAVKEAGLRLDIAAPMPNAPSMTMALEQFIVKHNKGK